MDIVSWFLIWWIKGIVTGFITTNVIPGLLSILPSPLKGIARNIINKTLIIKIGGFTLTIGLGTVIGYIFFSSS